MSDNEPRENFEKIAVIDNEVQAELVDAMLTEQGIPHLMRSYHDAALDGIFQATRGWGHVEAAREDREEILAVVEELKKKGPAAQANDEA